MGSEDLPRAFRELDQVAGRCFEFLISEKGCTGPTVEYWRDFFLVYQTPEDVRIRIGMERDWPVPFMFVEYRNAGHVLFDFREVLRALGVSIDSRQFSLCESLAQSGYEKGILSGVPGEQLKREWSLYLLEYSRVLRARFEEVVAYVKTAGIEQARGGDPTGGEAGQARIAGVVLRRAGEARSYDYVIGPGGFFLKAEFLPCERGTFWKIVDEGYRVSYSAAKCPSCGRAGNCGFREKQTAARRIVEIANGIALLLLIVSVVGLIGAAIWHRGALMQLGLLAMGVFVLFRLTKSAKGRMHEYFCPGCGSSEPAPESSRRA